MNLWWNKSKLWITAGTDLFAVLTMSFCGLSPAVWAQDEAGERMVLEEVVVTAQKREQSLQDVPIAISALTEMDIHRLNASDIKDLQYATPNMVVGSANQAQNQYGIRGIADVSRNPGYDQRIGVYVDGVWVGRSAASDQSVLDVETVEVLRGPQGTLFGKNTVSGAINIVTRKPSEEFGGYAQAEAGNFGWWRLKGAINLPYSGNFFGKISASVTRHDGFARDVLVSGAKYDDKDEYAIRGQLLWNISDATEVQLSFDDYRDHFAGLVSEKLNDALAPKPREVALDAGQHFKTENNGAALTINHHFANNFLLTSITGYRTEYWSLEDFDEDYSPLPLAFDDLIDADSDYFSEEIRLASPAGGKYDFVVGLYYLDQSTSGQSRSRIFAPALASSLPPIFLGVFYDAEVDAEQFAAFAHGNYRFNDRWSMTAGVRYTHESKDLDFLIVDGTGLFTTGMTVDSRSANDWSPRFGLNWFISEDSMLYASYARAFKSGGWNTDFIADFQTLPFDEEDVDAYEVGFKSMFADGRLRLNLALFHSDHHNYQVQSFAQLPNGGTALTITNAGEVTSKGLELELQWLAADWLQLWAAYGYTEAEFDRFKNCEAGGVDCTGNTLALAPKRGFSVGTDIRLALFGGELFLQSDYSYRDEFYTNPNNLPINQSESYHLVNGQVGWTAGSGAWTVYAWGRNLSGETRQIWNSRSFLGVARASYTEPRIYGLAVRWNFGTYY